jgi:hypothetical protein
MSRLQRANGGLIMSDRTPEQPEPKTQSWIRVHHLKSNFFRVVHADGVWCSVNAERQIHAAFYSERLPIPTSVFLSLDDNGIVTGEDFSKRRAKKDWIREMDVEVVFSLPVAKAVVENLQNFIKVAEANT